MAGGKIEILIDPDTQGFAGKLQGAMAAPMATAGRLGKELGVLLGVGSLAAAGTQIVKVGNDFKSALNELAGVSGATASQLEAVSARARELGSDATLIGVSAGDAAAAMTELAKGGMSVEQAMSAAHGTLQLAGAAQISAAEAATIQSAALQAFSLDAAEAGRVSDILANAANASSAEISDVAAAMSQSGTIAHQFGIDIDDTATAIAMFANAGIKGSDAGTMLKSALLALTDTGKPAQAAIEELGLTVYDTQGQFVGLPRLFDDLAAAQRRMTPEAYQAAAAVLFGSDAMRLAGVAGQQGGDGFRQLNEAMNRAGSAAELAEAKTQGLPGALSAIGNEAEQVALSLYDLVQGPLTSLANFTAEGISKVPGALSTVTDAAGAVPGPVWAAVASMVALRTSGLDAALDRRAQSAGSAMRRFGQDMDVQHRYAAASGVQLREISAAFAVLENRSPGLRKVAEAYRAGAAPAAEWAARQREAASAAQAASLRSTDLFTSFDRAGSSAFHGAAAGLGRFASVASGSASAAMSGLKMAATGLFNAVGGLPGILTGVAAFAIGQWASSNAEAAQSVAQHKADVDTLASSLDQVTGAITEATRATEAKKLADEGAFAAGREFGLSEQTVMNAAMGNADAQRQVDGAMRSRLASTAQAIAADADLADNIARGNLTVGDFTDALMLNQGALDKLAAAGIDTGWVLRHRTDDMVKLSDAVGASNGRISEAQAKFGELSRATGKAGLDAQTTAQAMRLMADSVTSIPDSKTVIVDSLTEQAQDELTRLGFTVETLPDGQIRVTAPGAMDTLALLDALGVKATGLPGGFIDITDNTPDAIARVDAMGLKVAHRDGRVVITDNSAQVRANVDRNLDGHNTSATHTINIVTTSTSGTRVGHHYGADGGILESYAGGGIRRYALGKLPDQAVIAAPQGARGLVQWAEDETEGEAFIPLARSKRDRSVAIWAEVGRRLNVLNDQTMGLLTAVSGASESPLVSTLAPGGVAAFADGGIMASGLIQFAKGIEGAPYVFGGWGNGWDTDCSGAQSHLANYVSGESGRFTTASQEGELARRGFLSGPGRPGDLRIGWFNGGPGGGHTAGTLPNGVNVEMGGGRGNGQYGGPAAGWNLPGATNWAHFPMSRFSDLDKAASSSAVEAAMKALGASDEVAGEVASGRGVEAAAESMSTSSGSQPMTVEQANWGGQPKTITDIVGEFGKDLFSGLTADALDLAGKSNELGPIAQAIMAVDAAAKNDFKVPVKPDEPSMGSGARSLAAGNGGDGPIPIPGLGDTSEVINYDPKAGTAQWRPLIRIALERTGQSPAEADRTEKQMGHESGGDPKAQNNADSNAAKGTPSKGLMQVIDPTHQLVRGKWPQHFTGLPEDLFHPLTNIVAGIDACVNSWGSLAARWPTTQGYAAGGKFMAAGTADRVAPSTFRIIGDRPDVDEYYLPDNDDPRTLAYGREWAERRGLQLIRMGDRRPPAAPVPAMAGSGGPARELTLVNNGFDRREVVAAADTLRRRDRLASRRQERP